LDPNQENGLGWWLAIERERSGEQGYIEALNKAKTLPGSWLPQLWLARWHLEKGEVDNAKALYQAVLASGGYGSEALMMVSGDLGNNGQVALIPDLIGSVFDPQLHDPRAGFNLLQAYLELGLRSDGEALLTRLYALNLAPYKQHLDKYAAGFLKLEARDSTSKPIESPEQIEIETIALDRPIWSYGLHDPKWLFALKGGDSPRVAFISFAKRANPTDQAEEQREDDVGRATRAIPLYLAEAVHYWTNLRATTLIPVVKSSGPVVFGAGDGDTELFDKLGDQYAYLVTGEIDPNGERWKVICRLWDCSSRTRIMEASTETALEGVGAVVLDFEQRLLAALRNQRATPVDAFYVRPTKELMPSYLTELGQSFTLSLLANHMVPKEGLWGERGMLDWPLNMSLYWPAAEVPKLMYVSGLSKATQYGSTIVPEFKTRTLELMRDAKRTNSPFSKLEPLVWRIFGMNEEFATAKIQTAEMQNDEYAQWLGKISDDS
jgi:hypothetical protein